MIFTINRLQFLDRLSSVNKAINPNSPIPELSGTLVDVRPDQIILTGSDNNITIQTVILPGELTGLQIEETGSLVMDFRYVLDMLRRMDGDTLKFETMDNNLIRITDKSGEYNLNTMNASDYPPQDLTRPDVHIQLSGKLLKEIFNQTSYAVSEKDARQVLLGIHLQFNDGTLRSSATDSYRLAHKIVPAQLEDEFSITVPKKSMQEVVRLIGDEDMADIYLSNKKVQFLFDKTLVQTQLFEGTYPNVERIIPNSFISTLTADAKELERVLERTTLFKDEQTPSLITMKLSPEYLNITTDSSQIGSSDQSLYNAVYEGAPLTLSLNSRFLLQAIKGLDCQDKVKLEFTGALKPIKITDPANEGLTMVVVPMKSYN